MTSLHYCSITLLFMTPRQNTLPSGQGVVYYESVWWDIAHIGHCE